MLWWRPRPKRVSRRQTERVERMNLGIGERRNHSRREKYLSQGLKISAYQPLNRTSGRPWIAAARVVDSSDGGLGVEMFEPLAVGVVVSASGELHSTGWCMSLTAQVRVTSCQNVEGGVFRIGLEFQDISYRPLDCNHFPELPESPSSP
jgi:hypothetical protein